MVQLLADGSTWTTIYTTSGGNGGVDDLPGLAGAGRYVRIMSTADDSLAGYGLYEFEVYGA